MRASQFSFALLKQSGAARAGRFETPHGALATPAFLVVGTRGAVRALTAEQVRATGAPALLANTYHLALRPGEALVQKLGGLHAFMGWKGPLWTDSGGFQVFSLEQKTIGERGVKFRNPVNGNEMELTPERSMEIQNALGADVIMAFDECTPFPADEKRAAQGVRRTLNWMERCLRAHRRAEAQALFGIVQGGVHKRLRANCAASLAALDLPGYAIGGVSVGEGAALLRRITAHCAPLLPENKPRYLMGVGLPEDVVDAIACGVDLFDCVIPTRYARAAVLFTRRGRIRVSKRRFRNDKYPPDPSCGCAVCSGGFSRAYLHHLFAANEINSAVLSSLHNTHFYQALVREARAAIMAGNFAEWRAAFLAEYQGGA